MDAKSITVTVDLPIKYKAVMNGMNVLVLEASIAQTYYDVKILPEEIRAVVLNAITEQVRVDDYEERFRRDLDDVDASFANAGLSD
jgi:hypothetical protein